MGRDSVVIYYCYIVIRNPEAELVLIESRDRHLLHSHTGQYFPLDSKANVTATITFPETKAADAGKYSYNIASMPQW